MSDDGKVHEIVIIKRHGGGHEDGHHGGAWKIAYADFVTAMMAFFLVMWLISANDKTKASIARYFNPVLLVDSTPQPPGLADPKPGSQSVTTKVGVKPPDTSSREPEAKATDNKVSDNKEAAGKEAPASPDSKAKKSEAELFKDPYALLAEIAEKEGAKDAKAAATAPVDGSKGGIAKGSMDGTKGGAAAAGSAGQKGGEAFRDPFQPMSVEGSGPVEGADVIAAAPPAEPPTAADTPASSRTAAQEAAAEPPAAPLPADPQAKAAELRNRIATLMKSVEAGAPGSSPKLEVKATSEGVLVTLTDDAKFAMFASASAEPSPKAVVLMAKIGKLLKSQKGRVVVRGFTDSRKFKSDTYDNWRLSSARADMAHYMLVRGGLDDARFERIEGYADRQPRNAKDPESADNRRIEILLREAP